MTMVDGSVHRFGCATQDIVKSEKLLGLGYSSNSDLVEDLKIGVCVKFYSLKNDSIKVELIMPVTPVDKPLKSILKQRSSFYHIALFSRKFLKTANSLELRTISNKMPAVAFEGAEIQFFVSRDMGISKLISYHD